MRIIVLFISILFVVSCQNRNDNNIKNLTEIIDLTVNERTDLLTTLHHNSLVAPKRYQENYLLAKNLNDQTILIDSLIVNLLDKKRTHLDNKIMEQIDKTLNTFNDILDSKRIIYQTSKGSVSNLEPIERYLRKIKEIAIQGSTISDICFLDYYIQKAGCLTFQLLLSDAQKDTEDVTSFQLGKKEFGDSLKIYISAFDTCNTPYLYVGKWEEDENERTFGWSELIDSIELKNGQATLNRRAMKENDVIVFYRNMNGSFRMMKVK